MLMYFFWPVYTVLMILLTVYALHRYGLVYLWIKNVRRKSYAALPVTWPLVTVQLPFFNEAAVVSRLVNGALALDYPQDRVEFQLLDDSTDETTAIAARLAAEARERGFNITHYHRVDRSGFKAGALHEGLKSARGEFVAIFDADFIPRREFLKKLVPYFADPRAGVVQATWAHLNCGASLLTRLQEVLTVSHFAVDQRARSAGGRFFNFNGTCGIWRREAINDAGGWQGDTLAEDLDLSYRAQLKGWRFVYVDEILADAELPADMQVFKKQQERWTRGTVQVACKVLAPVLTSSLPLKVKLECFLHLTNSVVYPLGLFAAVFVLPSIFWRWLSPGQDSAWDIFVFLCLSSVAFLYHLFGQFVRHGCGAWRQVFSVAAAVVVPMGLSAHLSVAAFKGLGGKPAVFVRTPKAGTQAREKTRIRLEPISLRSAGLLASEMLLTLYFLLSAMYAYHHHYKGNAFIMMLFAVGFGYVSVLSWRCRFSREWAQSPIGAEV
ncbi:MAG: glycosyltransferase [Candidatus Omnitrophica bacterium]|nr:glycosyltransferase [Candidatus Omnitrophota bacterium]